VSVERAKMCRGGQRRRHAGGQVPGLWG